MPPHERERETKQEKKERKERQRKQKKEKKEKKEKGRRGTRKVDQVSQSVLETLQKVRTSKEDKSRPREIIATLHKVHRVRKTKGEKLQGQIPVITIAPQNPRDPLPIPGKAVTAVARMHPGPAKINKERQVTPPKGATPAEARQLNLKADAIARLDIPHPQDLKDAVQAHQPRIVVTPNTNIVMTQTSASIAQDTELQAREKEEKIKETMRDLRQVDRNAWDSIGTVPGRKGEGKAILQPNSLQDAKDQLKSYQEAKAEAIPKVLAGNLGIKVEVLPKGAPIILPAEKKITEHAPVGVSSTHTYSGKGQRVDIAREIRRQHERPTPEERKQERERILKTEKKRAVEIPEDITEKEWLKDVMRKAKEAREKEKGPEGG